MVAKPAAANAKPAGIVGANIEKENNKEAKDVLRRTRRGGKKGTSRDSSNVMTIQNRTLTENVVPRIILVQIMDSVYWTRTK